VQPGSPAQDADIRSGDVIREIGRKPIRNVADFKAAMKKGSIKEGIVILVKRENTTFYTVLREE
jgi:serine protease Do